LFLAMLLLSVILTFQQPHKAFYQTDEKRYGAGSADGKTRAEILTQLNHFQDGYTRRDLSQVDSFVAHVFSGENILVLGTMPDEIYDTQRDVEKLIYSDWNAWGDCTFLMENAHISSSGQVAWFSTIGFVKFDVPNFLVMPLRLSGILVKENTDWKIQHLQFQFDLNLFVLFFTALILFLALSVNLVQLMFSLMHSLRASKPKTGSAEP